MGPLITNLILPEANVKEQDPDQVSMPYIQVDAYTSICPVHPVKLISKLTPHRLHH